jgi:hypothetical protein
VNQVIDFIAQAARLEYGPVFSFVVGYLLGMLAVLAAWKTASAIRALLHAFAAFGWSPMTSYLSGGRWRKQKNVQDKRR